jgi:hypothetical protein
LASVFIIESVGFDDERDLRLEGGILSQILQLSEKQSEYFYIRTKKEFKAVLREFEASGMRYLHISCHGNRESLYTTLDEMSFTELGELLVPYLKQRRLFVSACEAVNRDLAAALMPDSGCYSIIGPAREVGFGDAAVMWAACPCGVGPTLAHRDDVVELESFARPAVHAPPAISTPHFMANLLRDGLARSSSRSWFTNLTWAPRSSSRPCLGSARTQLRLRGPSKERSTSTRS